MVTLAFLSKKAVHTLAEIKICGIEEIGPECLPELALLSHSFFLKFVCTRPAQHSFTKPPSPSLPELGTAQQQHVPQSFLHQTSLECNRNTTGTIIFHLCNLTFILLYLDGLVILLPALHCVYLLSQPRST